MNELDAKADEVRAKLGLGRSGFYRYAIVEVVKQFATANPAALKEFLEKRGRNNG